MSKLKDLASIRQEYGNFNLLEEMMDSDPIKQFEKWLFERTEKIIDTPNAMVLSTVDADGWPDSRVVLLKSLDKGKFVFYTNYYSAKGLQLAFNPHAALNFYWPESMRQVRVRGFVEKVSSKESDDYFHSRPIASQLSTIASPQSQEIFSREKFYEEFDKLLVSNMDKQVTRPAEWGGYKLTPKEVEFWQGRDNRLHDRIQYYYKNDAWGLRRLAP